MIRFTLSRIHSAIRVLCAIICSVDTLQLYFIWIKIVLDYKSSTIIDINNGIWIKISLHENVHSRVIIN